MLTSEMKRTDLKAIAEARTPDGTNILGGLFGIQFSLQNLAHVRVLRSIHALIRTPKRHDGLAVDIDTGERIRVPLFCRSVADLVEVYANQLAIYQACRTGLIRYYNLPREATYENSVLLRQAVADREAQIKTAFRTELPTGDMDIDTEQRKPKQLTLMNPQQVIDHLQLSLSLHSSVDFRRAVADLYKVWPVVRGTSSNQAAEQLSLPAPAGGGNII